MKILILALAMTTLSGCAAISKVAGYGADINDDAIEAAKFTICQGASVGAIRRQFTTQEQIDLWTIFKCDHGETIPGG